MLAPAAIGGRRAASAPTATSSRCAASSRRCTAPLVADRRAASARGARRRRSPRRISTGCCSPSLPEHPVPHRILRLERAARSSAQRDVVLITDFRYQTQVARRSRRLARVVIEPRASGRALAAARAAARTSRSLGFESAHLAPPRLPAPARGGRALAVAPDGRSRRDAARAEGRGRSRAASRARPTSRRRALERTLPQVRAGMTELEVAGILEKALRDEGSEGFPFPSIVAIGTALGAAARALVGARASSAATFCSWISAPQSDGYCSDVTRTVVVGTRERRAARGLRRRARRERARRGGCPGRDDRPGCRRARARLH